MGKGSLTAAAMAPSDREAWDDLAARHGCIFDSVRWTGLFEPGLRRVGLYDGGGRLRGGFCVYEERRWGLRILRNPPFTRQVGPFFEPLATNASARTEEQRSVIEAMAAYLSALPASVLSIGLSHGISDCLPFRWRGYKVVPSYTYRLDLAAGESSLFAGMSIRQRNSIRKAEKDGIGVEETTGSEHIRALVSRTFRRQQKPFPEAAMDRILAAFPPGFGSFCLVSTTRGLPVAGVYVVHDGRTAYCILTGYDDRRAHHGAGAAAMWQAIRKSRSLGLAVFDFEGSVIPPIEHYFRGFGGILLPVMGVHKAWLPLEAALKLSHRELF